MEHLVKHKDFQVVRASVPPRERKVWWSDVVDEDELERLGLTNSQPEEVIGVDLDLCFSVLTGHIFTPKELAVCDIINVHPAPLPYYRGCNSYAHAIINHETWYGVSMHYIDEGIDTGPVIDVDWCPIARDETGHSLYHKAQPLALQMFKHNVRDIFECHSYGSRVATIKQDSTIAKYYKRDSLKEHMVLHTSDPESSTKYRALTFPPHQAPIIL